MVHFLRTVHLKVYLLYPLILTGQISYQRHLPKVTHAVSPTNAHESQSHPLQLAVSLIYPVLVLLHGPVSEAFDL